MPTQAKPATGQALENSRSLMNPTDVVAMTQQGRLSPDMSIRDLFSQMGVDVDGPITQLARMKADQMQKAMPSYKMNQMANSQAPGMGMGPSRRQPVPQESGGIADLLKP